MRPLRCFTPRVIPTISSWRLLCERVYVCLNLFHKQSCFGLKKAWDIYESWQQTVGVHVSVCVRVCWVCVSLVVVKNNRARLSQSQTSVMVRAEYLFSISAGLCGADFTEMSLRTKWWNLFEPEYWLDVSAEQSSFMAMVLVLYELRKLWLVQETHGSIFFPLWIWYQE